MTAHSSSSPYRQCRRRSLGKEGEPNGVSRRSRARAGNSGLVATGQKMSSFANVAVYYTCNVLRQREHTYHHRINLSRLLPDLLPQSPLLIGILIRVRPGAIAAGHGVVMLPCCFERHGRVASKAQWIVRAIATGYVGCLQVHSSDIFVRSKRGSNGATR